MTVVFRHGGLRLYLLGLLAEAPRHGYEVIVELENRFMGSYSPSAGTVYPRLAKLEAEGLLEHDEESGRKVYRITEAGRAELAAHIDELQDVMREVSASAAQAASELRREVSDSAAALREELLAAAREARRADRVDGRASRDGFDSKGFPFVSKGSASAELRDFTRAVGRLTKTALRDAMTADAERLTVATARVVEFAEELTGILGHR